MLDTAVPKVVPLIKTPRGIKINRMTFFVTERHVKNLANLGLDFDITYCGEYLEEAYYKTPGVEYYRLIDNYPQYSRNIMMAFSQRKFVSVAFIKRPLLERAREILKDNEADSSVLKELIKSEDKAQALAYCRTVVNTYEDNRKRRTSRAKRPKGDISATRLIQVVNLDA